MGVPHAAQAGAAGELWVLGEALVDEFHDGAVPGGAPFNLARSLAALGLAPRFITRLNPQDEAGRCLLDSARRYGLDTSAWQRDSAHGSGRVQVVEQGGTHRFEILADVAWDHLQPLAAAAPGWVYYGTLMQRQPASRAALRAAVKQAAGPRFLDLNLRPGADTPELIAESLMLADWVKVNEDELQRLLALFTPDVPDLGALMARFALRWLVVTRGALGYQLFDATGRLQAQGAGEPVPRLVDTVGAGDAFTAVLLGALLLGRDVAAALALANRYAAMICGQRGPLPPDPQDLAPWRAALWALPEAAA